MKRDFDETRIERGRYMKTFNFLKNLGSTKIALSQHVRLSIMRIGTAFLLGLSFSPQAMAYERIFEIALKPFKLDFIKKSQRDTNPVFGKLALNAKDRLTNVDRIIQDSLNLNGGALPAIPFIEDLIKANVFDEKELAMIKNLKDLQIELLKLRTQVIIETPQFQSRLDAKNIEIGKAQQKSSDSIFSSASYRNKLASLEKEKKELEDSKRVKDELLGRIELQLEGISQGLSFYRGVGAGRLASLKPAEADGVAQIFHERSDSNDKNLQANDTDNFRN